MPDVIFVFLIGKAFKYHENDGLGKDNRCSKMAVDAKTVFPMIKQRMVFCTRLFGRADL